MTGPGVAYIVPRCIDGRCRAAAPGCPDADILWVLSVLSILGTILWCLILGVVLLVRSFRSAPGPAAMNPAVAGA